MRAAAPRDGRGDAAWRSSTLPVDARGARTDLLAQGSACAAVLVSGASVPDGSRPAPAIGARRRSRGRLRAAELIVEDDYDGELRYDRQPVGALQALAPAHVVYGGTASKTLAPGPAARLAGRATAADRRDRRACARPRTCTSRRRIRSRSATCCARARTSGTCAACVRATALAATAWSRCSPSARRRSCPSGSQRASGCCWSSPTGGPTSAELIAEAERRSLALVPAGAALSLAGARRATAS